MAGIKTFVIQINGIQESIDAVSALNSQLSTLESRINALANKSVGITAGASKNSTSSINEEDKLKKQILQTEEKITAVRTENYQRLLAEKELLKEAVEDQKERAANERLFSNTYSNTMRGLKDELSDIKKVMQTTDLGDDAFKDLVERANQLTTKLKEIEAQYGQFGRNVGNYASAAEGFTKFTVKIGDTVREFSSAREASRQLKQELLSLGEGAEGVEDLKKAINSVDSAIKDATVSSEAMDNALDWMQSFTAMASAGQGLVSFFGLDDTSIEESLKNLMALQTALNGIETLSKQLNTSEGIGKYFSKANKTIDDFTKKLFKVKPALNEAKKGESELAAATSQVGTAAKSAAVSEGVQTVATAGLTIGMRIATVAARALGVALKAIGIGLVLEAVSLLIEGIKSLGSAIVSSMNTAEKQINALDNAMDGLARRTSAMMEALNNAFDQGTISKSELLTEQYRLQAEYMEQIVAAMRQRQNIENGSGSATFAQRADDVKIVESDFISRLTRTTMYVRGDLLDVRREFRKTLDAIEHGEDYMTRYGENLSDFMASLVVSVDDTVDLHRQLGEAVVNDFLARIIEAENELAKAQEDVKNGVDSAGDKLVQAQNTIKNLFHEMNHDDILNTTLANLDDYMPTERIRENANIIINSFRSIFEAMNADEADVARYFENLRIEILPQNEQALARLEQQYQQDLQNYGRTEEQKTEITNAYNIKRQRLLEQQQRKTRNTTTRGNTQAVDAEKELNRLRMRLMEEGLSKRLMSLEEEKRQTLNKLKDNNAAYLEAERMYIQLREREIRQSIEEISREIQNIDTSTKNAMINSYDAMVSEINNEIEKMYLERVRSNELITESEKELLMKEEHTNAQRLANAQSYMNTRSGMTVQEQQMYEEEYKRELFIIRQYGSGILRTLSDHMLSRFETQKEFYIRQRNFLVRHLRERIETENAIAQEELELQNAAAEEERKTQLRNLQRLRETASAMSNIVSSMTQSELAAYNELLEQVDRIGEKEVEIEENYNRQIETNERNHRIRLAEIDRDAAEEMSRYNETYFNTQLSNFRDFNSKISQVAQRQPIYDKFGFGIVNLSETRKNYKEILNAALETLSSIKEAKEDLDDALQHGFITPEVYNASLAQFNDVERTAKESLKSVRNSLKELGKDFYESINKWVQEVGNSANSILSSLSEIQSNKYDKMIEEQEEYIEKYESLLEKQKDKTQAFADAINEIEGELSSARGDRRQMLIDQLNAEMAARRQSLAQEKKIEKEKEKAEEKKKKLEHDQAVAKKKMDLAQAYINAAMAVSMAAVNHWPVPAIPMMALATAVGAAQIAAVASQNIPKYASGGVIEGKPHSQGGVKVLGGYAEVEGNEYIVNKETTSRNVELLDYINSRRKRIDISDLIEFYSSPKPSRGVTSVRTKFADGGTLPQLRGDITINDRMVSAMEDYSNRPVYVSVVDIIDKTERLNEVKAMSGLR